MADRKDENKAGKYDLIKNDAEKSKTEGRLYYQTYIPADLMQVEVTAEDESAGLKRIYREIGKMQGLRFFEENPDRKNRKLCQQDAMAMLESEGVRMELEERFGNQPSSEVKEKMNLYVALGKEKNLSARKILQGVVRTGMKDSGFRKVQIWEDPEVKRISLREHNPPTPERVPGLMKGLEAFSTKKNLPDPVIHAGLLCYQFLTIMPFEKDNELWASVLLNSFLREQGIGAEYYIPFGRYLFKRDADRKEAMKQVRESGDYGIWIHFFVEMAGQALEKTNQMLMALEQLHRESHSSILKEKQKELLQSIISYMEETPVFTVADIENQFDIAYNTAAKMIAILGRHDVVREISERQRYRIFCYESYVQEIL